MDLKISAKDSRHTNPKVHLFAICSQWLPLAKAILSMVVTHLPSPLQLTEERVERLMCNSSQTFQSLPLKTQSLKDSEKLAVVHICRSSVNCNVLCVCLSFVEFLSCDVDDSSPLIVYISKLFVMDKTTLPQYQTRYIYIYYIQYQSPELRGVQ